MVSNGDIIIITLMICRLNTHAVCDHMHTGEEKLLYRQCEGHFLTDPGSVRLYLPEIAEFFHESLPIVAKLFINSDVTDDSVSSFASEVVKMTHIGVESAIIATSWNAEETGESEQTTPIAIPIDLNIEVSLIELQPGNNEDLYQMTRQLFEGFHSSVIKDMKQAATYTSNSAKMLQRKLKGSIRKGHERQGVEVEKPTKAYRKKSKIKNTGTCNNYRMAQPMQWGASYSGLYKEGEIEHINVFSLAS